MHEIIQLPATRDWLFVSKKQTADVFLPPNFVQSIKRFVCKEYDITINDIDSARRSPSLVIPRHIAMYLVKEFTKKSYPEIGRRFGGKDHTSVLHACRNIEKRMAQDQVFACEIAGLKERLESDIATWREKI